jgi:aspartate-semialdehyde dehydrogenase
MSHDCQPAAAGPRLHFAQFLSCVPNRTANVEFEHEISVEDAREALYEFEGVLLIDDPANGEHVTPAECVGEYGVFVSRVRRDPTVPHGLSMWIVADNLRKGAALNAVQIAEALVAEGYL